MAEAFIVDAVRTAVSRRAGGFAAEHPADMAAHVIKTVVGRHDIDTAAIDDVILGCLDNIGAQAGDIARTATLAAGLPESVPGVTIDRQCGSAQQAVHFAAQAVMSGTSDLIVAGGVQKMSQYPDILEPLLFYILHRASAVIRDKKISQVFKAFFIDEAWIFLKNPSIQKYVVEALKTWRKHNAAMVLSTQSLDELRRSELLDVVLETCVTKIFLANPDMDRALYRHHFHLNEREVELISGLVPKQQFLIKTPELAKVVNLTVDSKSYWLYTNDPYDNRKREQALAAYGFEHGLEVLSRAVVEA